MQVAAALAKRYLEGMMTLEWRSITLAAWVATVVPGCSAPPLEFGHMQLGRSVSADHSVGQPATAFKPEDTVYVAIQTTNTGAGTVGVKWMYAGQVLSEPSKKVAYKGAGNTEFHISESGGLPEGSYSVEGFIDGKSVGTRTFTVAR
jgi:hypothetical protein